MIIEQSVRLTYPARLLKQPLIHGLIRDFDLLTNILEAHLTPQGGYLVVALRGEEQRLGEGLRWMEGLGVEVEILSEAKEEA